MGQGSQGEDVGFIIPVVQVDVGMRADYKDRVLKDDSLRNWKKFAGMNENGFFWDKRVLKRRVNDEVVTDIIVNRYVAVDIAGPFPRACGYAYLVTYICLASKYSEAISPKCATAQEYAKELLDITARNRVPDMILSDQGSRFMGYMKYLCKRLGMEQIQTTPYRPQSNVVEHFMAF